MIYHGHKGLARENSKFILKDSKTKEDKYGTGAYFKKDPKMRKEIDVIAIDEKKLKTLKGDDEMPKKLVNELLRKAPDKYWWVNMSNSKKEAMAQYRTSLNGKLVDDIQSLYYDVYPKNPEQFVEIVGKHFDAMELEEGNLFVLYNMKAIDRVLSESFKDYMKTYR